MAAQISAETECKPKERNSPIGFDEQVIAQGSLDFDEWASLISDIENSFPDDLEKICLVYDSFLAEFPLCYGYWMKYANHKARLGNADAVVQVFERAVQSATYSVDVWFHYCSFSISAFEDPDAIRRLFKRALSFVGKDYLSHTLWDKYLAFEFSQQQWSSLAHIYIQTLKFPSKKLHRYYDSFKKLAAALKGELDCQNDSRESQLNIGLESGVPSYYRDVEISRIIKDLLEPSVGLARSKAMQKYLYIGEQMYKEACQLDEKIHCFETRIRRPYFHVKPLDWSQLENWHDYLNFAEKQEDFDWVVKLYERCLVPCANYPEFWMRYVDFMESKGGREIANFALDRATQIFMKRTSLLHLFNARYKEQIGDVSAARAAFLECDTESDSSFIENVTIKANMEKRLGNFLAACKIYKEALDTAAEKKKLHALPILYVHFSQLKYMTADSADAARDILIDGIRHVPHSKLLLQELIKFVMMQGGSRHVNVVDSVIANALYSGPDALGGFSLEDVEDISRLYLQFVDLCGTIHDVRKAWNRHIKYFPHSLRASVENPARSTKPLKPVMEVRRENTLPPRQSGPHHSTQSPSQDKKLSPPENYDTQSDPAVTALLSDQKSPLPQNHDIESDSAIVDHLQSGEADSRLQEEMQQVSHEVTEQHIEDSCVPKDSCEPNASSVDLVHQIANETEAEASQELCKEDNVPQEYEHEQKQDLKPLSLEGLTLDPQENQSPGSNGAISHEHEVPQEIKLSHESTSKSEALEEAGMSNGSMPEDGQITKGSHCLPSLMNTQVSDSALIQTGSVSPPPSVHQNFMTEAHSRPQTPRTGGRDWHQKHNSDKFHRDSRFGFRGHSRKRLHQQHQASPHPYRGADTHAQKPMSSNNPSQPLSSQNPQIQQGRQAQTQYPASANITSPQAWPMQNLQQPNFSSACQSQLPAQPVAYAQAQMSQFPSQNNEQHGHPQNNQMYNQMWQYYYYQQQQQQFLLQQLNQLPHQQQLVQQQYQSQYNFQQQQQLRLQQQQFLPQQQQPYPQHQHSLYLQNQQVQQQPEEQQQQLPPQQLQEAHDER